MRLATSYQRVFNLLLNARRPMYGLEMVLRSDGDLKRGTIYVVLDRMETLGLVTSEQEKPKPGVSGIPRRRYQVTRVGVATYRKWLSSTMVAR